MSTNHTRNYNLCQWEASDQVLREDFNADNAKIDAALGSHAAQIAQALTTAGNAFSPGKLPVVTGPWWWSGSSCWGLSPAAASLSGTAGSPWTVPPPGGTGNTP